VTEGEDPLATGFFNPADRPGAFSGETELAMAVKNNASPREGLTFDDVLIKPGLVGGLARRR
jgi:hypothetical protein